MELRESNEATCGNLFSRARRTPATVYCSTSTRISFNPADSAIPAKNFTETPGIALPGLKFPFRCTLSFFTHDLLLCITHLFLSSGQTSLPLLSCSLLTILFMSFEIKVSEVTHSVSSCVSRSTSITCKTIRDDEKQDYIKQGRAEENGKS